MDKLALEFYIESKNLLQEKEANEPDEKDVLLGLGAGAAGTAALTHPSLKKNITGRETFYHGTSPDYVPNIQQQGIVPSASRGSTDILEKVNPRAAAESRNMAFVTPNKTLARQYAEKGKSVKKTMDYMRANGKTITPDTSALLNSQWQQAYSIDPKMQMAVQNPTNNAGILEVSLPSWKEDIAAKIKQNPEVAMGKEKFTQNMRMRGANPISANNIYNLFNKSKGIEGGVSPEFIKNSPKYKGLGFKELGQYIKAKPGQFAKGLGLGALGVAGLGYGANKLYNAFNQNQTLQKQAGTWDGVKSFAKSHPATVIGGGLGMGIGGYIGYNSDSKKHKLRNTLMGIGAGGLSGGILGAAVDEDMDLTKRTKEMDKFRADKNLNQIINDAENILKNRKTKYPNPNYYPKQKKILTKQDIDSIKGEINSLPDGEKAEAVMKKIREILKGTEKNASLLDSPIIKNNVVPFIKSHPKATEGAVVGGLLGAGSELVMPSNKDAYGNPSTNLKEIAKRGLLGAAMGGVGGELKSRVRAGIQKLASGGLVQWMKNNPATTIGGIGGLGLGGYYGYNNPENISTMDGTLTKDDKFEGGLRAGIAGLSLGLTGGHVIDSLIPLIRKSNIVGTIEDSPNAIKQRVDFDSANKIKNEIYSAHGKMKDADRFKAVADKILEHSPVLPKDLKVPDMKKAKIVSDGKPKMLMAKSTIKQASSKILNTIKNNPAAFGLGGSGAIIGGLSGYNKKGYNNKDQEVTPQKKTRLINAGLGAVGGGISGAFLGSTLDDAKSVVNTAKNMLRSSGGRIYKAEKKIPGALSRKGKLIQFPKGKKAKNSPIPKGDKTPKGTVIKFPEKTASFLAPYLQRAGNLMAKNPQLAGAAIGAGGGLAANTLSGSDSPIFSTVVGAGLGALGGRKIVANAFNAKEPLFGKSIQKGVSQGLRENAAIKQVGNNSIKAKSLTNAPSLHELAQQQGTPIKYPVKKPNNPINIPPRVPESLPGTY